MTVRIIHGDCRDVLKTLLDESVHCCVTSPPYFGLRDYGVNGQIGLEKTPEDYVAEMVAVFREVRRVLRDDGTLWLNLGDSYAGSGKGRNADETHREGGKQGTNAGTVVGRLSKAITPCCKPKDLIGIPWRVAFALQSDGWYLRQDIIWHKPNPMPESVTDRCTKAHEYIFLLSKSAKYYLDADAIKEPSSCHENRPSGVVRDREYGYDSKQKALGRHKLGEKQTFGGNKARQSKIAENDPRYRNGSEQWGRDFTLRDTRNKRSVWTVPSKPYSGAHFATFPPALIDPCIKAGCPQGGMVIDPFGGAGTTGLVADRNGRDAILIELNADYREMSKKRIVSDMPMFAKVST